MWHLIGFKYAEEYVSFWLTEFLHSWPHIAYQGLQKYSSTFDPDDAKYVQTLIFWGAIPILLLILSLLLVIVYGICQCCKNGKRQGHPVVNRPRRTSCLKWIIITLALLTTAFVGAGFYGNETTASGVQHFIQSAENSNETIENAEQEIHNISNDLTVILAGEVEQLELLFRTPIKNTSIQHELERLTQVLKHMVNDAATNVSAINSAFSNDVNLGVVISEVQYYETFRWLGFVGVFFFELIISLMVLCGACTRNRCSLICSAMLCTFGVLLVWCLAGAELFVAMGLSDFCVNPNPFIIKEAEKNGHISNDLINYYIQCNKTAADPFSQGLSSANKYLVLAGSVLDEIFSQSKGYYDQTNITAAQKTVSAIISDLQMLTANLDCTTGIHKDYTTSLYDVCYDVVIGVTFMLLSAVLSGLLFTLILVCSISYVSKMQRRKIGYAVDQQDPFLPPDNPTATLERYRRNVEPTRAVVNETPPPIPSDHRARPVSLSSSLHGYRPQTRSPKPSDARNVFTFLQDGHDPGPSTAQGWSVSQRGGVTSSGRGAASTSNNQPPVSPGGYDSPPPSYTLAMSRDNQRRNPENRQRQAQARLSSGSLV
ncbi:protein tweety homolog 1-A-like isoform X1 [Asterias rubens]|uniref:protein tweety homolog 1-A-like isoform X1 n=1 Tax=Asterias rubens TaxID=7604 RepID=UPI0014558FFB|nr:protein tweety homolog 1-A-like isoform X1 [Asterias rubens]